MTHVGRPRSHDFYAQEVIYLRSLRIPKLLDDKIGRVMKETGFNRTAVTILMLKVGLEHFEGLQSGRESAQARSRFRPRKIGQGRFK